MMKSLMSNSFFLLSLAGALLAVNPRTDSPDTEGLYHVLVTTDGDHLGHCGGTLVSAEWVLTAYYCKRARMKMEVIVGNRPGQKKERMKVKNEYVFTEKARTHNILMLQIDSVASSTAMLPPITNCQPPKDKVKFYGWINPLYDIDYDNVVPQKLQTGELQVSNCQTVPREEKQPVTDQVLKHQDHHLKCAKHPAGVNDCELFAGTSLMHDDVLYGVLVNYDILCQKQVEFLDVCAYRKWIGDVINGVARKSIAIAHDTSSDSSGVLPE